MCDNIPRHRNRFLKRLRGKQEKILSLFFLCVILRYSNLVFRHIDDMRCRIVRVVNIAVSFPFQINTHYLSVFRRPSICCLPFILAQSIIFHFRRPLNTVIRPFQEMVQPHHTLQIHIITQGIRPHIDSMQIIFGMESIWGRMPCVMMWICRV